MRRTKHLIASNESCTIQKIKRSLRLHCMPPTSPIANPAPAHCVPHSQWKKKAFSKASSTGKTAC